MAGLRSRRGLARIVLALALGMGVGFAGPGWSVAHAQIATTTLADTVYHADGTAAKGTIIVSWPSFTTMTGRSVPGGSQSVTIGVGGALSVALAPNVGATPVGSYYTAVYHLDDGSVQKEFWVIPVSASPVGLGAVRNTVLPISVAMQTVSKSYVDTAIAAALDGTPLDASGFVQKTGDTMTGPLVLPADPVSANQAADKHYVDTNIAAATGGLGQKVALLPAVTQVVTQPAGTDLEANRLNGVQYASQYATQGGNNGVAGATASADCVAGSAAGTGCVVVVEPGVSGIESYSPTNWANRTHVVDERLGGRRDSYFNPRNPFAAGIQVGQTVDLRSTESAQAIHQQTGTQGIESVALAVTHSVLTGGSNLFPEAVETPPYFKASYSAMTVTGSYNTQGQHVLVPNQQNCYAVGDCLIGAQFLTSMGGYRDSADEGTHPFDLQVHEDPRVFTGTCSAGCSTGSRSITVGSQTNGGTQGDGRFLIDKNPAKVITQGLLVGGASTGIHAAATFSGSSFPVSTFFSTTAIIPSTTIDIAPGVVTVAIATSGVPAGFSTSTAAAPATSGVACVVDRTLSQNPQNYEMATYTVTDGTHLQMTLAKPHAAQATVAMGGLCGYGIEQTVDTASGIRQVFPVIGASSATSLYYSGALTAVLGISGQTSAYLNASTTIVSAVRNGNVVTLTTSGGLPDVTGLTLTVAGVTDSSYNGSFSMTSTGSNTITYAETGANSTSSGGVAGILTGGYALYPMAEVTSVYNTATKAVDGMITLAPNNVAWGTNDSVEEPHYFQVAVNGDIEFIGQTTPRPSLTARLGYQYEGNNGPGLQGFLITNATPAANYFGNGGTHGVPDVAYVASGIWKRTFDMQAGEQSVFSVHCNSKGCGRWNSGYNLFELDSSASVDTMSFQPGTSGLSLNLRGTGYSFTPQAFTAGTANITTLNATNISASSLSSGTVPAVRLPIMGASGASHAVGAVPDPGATAGTTRYLREDGTWATPAGTGGGGSGSGGADSFNGRTGAIVPASGDYSFSQISGTVDPTQLPALGGDVSTAAGSATTSLATVNTSTGTFGSSGAVPIITVDGKGRITAATTAAIVGPGGSLAVPSSLNAGLLADYNFYQQSGTVLNDVSGNGNNGTLSTGTLAPTWTATGLAFLPGQGVSLPAALNPGKTFMIEAYLNPLVTLGGLNDNYPLLLTSSLGQAGINLLTDYATGTTGYVGKYAYAPAIYGGSVQRSAAPNLLSGFHVLTYVLGTGTGNLDHLYIDGNEVASYTVQIASAGLQASGNLFFGSSNVNPWIGSGLNGTAYRMRVYSTQLAAADVANVTQAMYGEAALRGIPTSPAPINVATAQFHAVGDSITFGYLAAAPYSALLSLTNQPSYTITNWGIVGITALSVNASEPNRVAPYCRSSSGPALSIVTLGTNDLASVPGATVQSVFRTMMGEVQILKQAGCRVLVGTMLSRTGNDPQGATLDADKNAYNALILAQARGLGADGLVDFAAIPQLGADGANAGTFFNADHTHPTSAGQQLMANAASNALNYYFGANELNPKVVTTLPYTMAAGDGAVSTAGLTNAGALTLPDCTGQSGAAYRVNNPQGTFAVTIGALNTSQPINGLTTSLTVPPNGSLVLRDVPNAKTVSGCHWEM